MPENMKKEDNSAKRQIHPIIVYQFNDEISDFEDLKIDPEVHLNDLLDGDFILLFIDPQHFRVWLWHGYNTTTRMKFIAAKMAPPIRDKHGIVFKITAVDQDNETNEFFDMIGLRETITLEQLLNELGENPFKTPPEIKLLKRFSTIEKGKGKGKSFIPLSSQLGIPGTSYRIQLGLINGKWASRLLKGKNVIDSYVYKEEDLRKKSNRDGDDDDFFFPYPYIFNPPRPPDDFEMEPQVQVRVPLKEKDPEGEVNCQYCGRKLTKEEQITHSCKKKPKST